MVENQSGQNSLVIFTQAALMLAEADTIQKANELKNLALTAADWAKRKGMGDDAIKHCRSYALEAERKMGEMLLQTDRAKANQYTKSAELHSVTEQTPTLAELGITKRDSSDAQLLATLPADDFNDIKSGKKSKAKIKKEANLKKRKQRYINETRECLEEKAIILQEDCLDRISSLADIDLLIADPPYFTDGNFTLHISKCLERVKPTGQAYIFMSSDPLELAAYLEIDTEPMRLEQVLIWNYNNTGQRQPNDRYTSNYQVIFYYRGPEAPPLNKPSDGTHQYACQTINAPDGRLGDRYHAWQKPMELIERFIRNSSKPGDFVFDPFAGSGTTLLAAAKLGRKAFGCEIDPDAIKICLERGCVYDF